MCLVPQENGTYEISWADFLGVENPPEKFYDWYTFDNEGAVYEAYVLTGYSFVPNGASKNKQATYISTFMEKTETGFTESFDPVNESGCIMQSRWDFTGTSTANKWDAGQQIYRHKRMFIPAVTTDFDDGYDVVVAKSKIRGRGKALQLKFSSEEGKDMRLSGWSIISYAGLS